MFYLAWISVAVILYIICGWLTIRANEPNSSWNWVIALYGINFLGLWPLIARYSKNIIFDGLLYDLLIFFVFYGTVVYLGAAHKFTTLQWAGTGMVIVGFLVLKFGGSHVH